MTAATDARQSENRTVRVAGSARSSRTVTSLPGSGAAPVDGARAPPGRAAGRAFVDDDGVEALAFAARRAAIASTRSTTPRSTASARRAPAAIAAGSAASPARTQSGRRARRMRARQHSET